MPNPVVAVVGRPNVGKSTLFNRIIGRRQSIVDPQAGLTRDRLYGNAEWRGRYFLLVDTAGLEPGVAQSSGDLRPEVEAQVQQALDEADVIVFLLDIRDGLTPLDRDLAQMLRRSKCPVLVAGNKAESQKQSYLAHEIYELGLDAPTMVSALKGVGVDDLLDRILELLPPDQGEEPEVAEIKVAILGRPNVGKSSLLNKLVGSERSVVSNIPGTTRDPVDTLITHDGRSVLLVDTAGVRRRRSVNSAVEHYSLLRGLKAAERADVVALVMDASEGVTAHDRHLAGYVSDAGRGMVMVLNKWDLLSGPEAAMDGWRAVMNREYDFLPYVDWVGISAKTGRGVTQVLDQALKVADERKRRIPTRHLNRVLKDAMAEHPPPSFKGKRLELNFATQSAELPPTFVMFVNDEGLMHFSYRRYLEKKLRQEFAFTGSPIRLVLRAGTPRGRDS